MKPAELRRSVKMFLRDRGIEVSRTKVKGQENLLGYVEDDFRQLYQKYAPYTMVSWSGLYGAYRAVNHIIDHDIKGDLAECGVWKGGCSAFMMELLKRRDQHKVRKFYLYDTFEGMTAPTGKDVHFSGAQFAQKQFKAKQKADEKWSYSPLEEVKTIIAKAGYPESQTKFIKGDVRETLEETKPKTLALLRLDTDWYDSTKAEMQHLYPRLQSGGVLICDDYGAWKGSYEAIHDYFKETGQPTPLLQVDTSYGGATAIKP